MNLHSRYSQSQRNGFTLIELMVTVGIVAILATIALPSYQQYVIRGKRAAAKSAMMDLANREQQHLLADRRYADATTLTSSGFAPDTVVTQNYTWTVAVDNAATPPRFTITFSPIGGQTSDGPLTLNSQGTKTPTAKWER